MSGTREKRSVTHWLITDSNIADIVQLFFMADRSTFEETFVATKYMNRQVSRLMC